MSDEEPRFGLDPDAAIRAQRESGRQRPADSAAKPPADPPGMAPADPSGTPPVDPSGKPRRKRKPPVGAYRPPGRIPVVIETRKYQWMIGGFGLALVIAFSIYLAARGGNGTPGVQAGQQLHRFVAPLATSRYADIPANAKPKCNPAKPNPQGLNICDRQATVLAFFATSGGFLRPTPTACINQVDAMQDIASRFPHVLFAAVAVNADRAATLALVHAHHWTIRVAYDSTGIIGEVYGVTVCPIVELANANGVVVRRLIGQAWSRPAALSAAVGQLSRP